MKTAFIFPGQGSQKPQMGLEFLDNPKGQNLLEQTQKVLDFSVLELLEDEHSTKLHETKYTQPLLLFVSKLILQFLEEEGFHPDIVAGLSLGEYSALMASGALSYEEALMLVSKRGEWMQEAANQNAGSMAAILGLEDEVIEKVCKELQEQGLLVSPANYNTPGQLVIGGKKDAVEIAVEKLKEQGAKRAIVLPVSGAFHTELMTPAAEKFNDFIETISFQTPSIPVLSNVTGVQHSIPIKAEILTQQITHSVKWKQNVEWMLEQGVRVFVEIGPGKSLSQMIKQIAKSHSIEVTVLQTESMKLLDQTVQELRRMKEGNR